MISYDLACLFKMTAGASTKHYFRLVLLFVITSNFTFENLTAGAFSGLELNYRVWIIKLTILK